MTDAGLDAIMSERPRLLNVAYRLLGSLAEAEDAVQETCLRWYAMPKERQEAVESPGAWLTTVVGRICLDLLGSARARRESYVGQWVPEPLPGDGDGGGGDPADRITRDESVDMAFLVVLESMTPAERVAFILHDVFRYPFAEVAGIVGRTPAACRQLATSARRRVRAAEGGPAAPVGRQAGLVRDFKQAWEAQDIAGLVGLLDPGATMVADGGGLVGAVLHPVTGSEQIARYIAAIGEKAPGMTLLECAVNGRPGLMAQRDGVTVTVAAFACDEDGITHIWAVRNPEKLRPWTTGDPGGAVPQG